MAKADGNALLQNVRGRIGKELVVKQYSFGTVIAKYPDMPARKKATALKGVFEGRFKEAVVFARAVKKDPVLKKQYEARLKPGQRLYNYCISLYLRDARLKDKSTSY